MNCPKFDIDDGGAPVVSPSFRGFYVCSLFHGIETKFFNSAPFCVSFNFTVH